jgi:nucleoid DNA-binding protein
MQEDLYNEDQDDSELPEVPYRKYTSKAYRELIQDVVEASGYYKYQVKDILDCLSYCIATRMVEGKRSQIDNLGSFALKTYEPRIIKLPNHYTSKITSLHLTDTIVSCKFKPAEILKKTMKDLQMQKDYEQGIAALDERSPDEVI